MKTIDLDSQATRFAPAGPDRAASPWRRAVLGGLGLAAGLGLASLLGACVEETACGEGTVLVGSECVPLQMANCQGEGVRFVDGRCVPDYTEVCGPGTRLSEDGTRCVGTGDVADAGADADTGGDSGGGEDVSEDTGTDVASDATADAGADTADVGEPFEPECADDLAAGERICLWGTLLNFITLAPVTGDAEPDLEVEVKHLLSAQGNPAIPPIGSAVVRPDGNFIIPGFDIPGDGTENTLLIIAGEAEESAPEGPGTVWQRTLGGLITIPEGGSQTEFGEQSLFTIPRAAVAGWNEALELAPGTLETTGFQLIRVVDATRNPVQGATVSFSGTGETVRYFQDAAMTQFRGPRNQTTGPSGAVLVTGVSTGGTCSASVEDESLQTVQFATCQTSPGRLSVGVIVMIPSE